MRRSYQGVCPTCGEAFLSGYPYRIYCSPECRQDAASERMRSRQPLPPARPQRQLVQAAAPEQAADTTSMEVRKWNGVGIQRRGIDGWVNATAMCQAGGREWFTYSRGNRTQEYIAALAGVLGSPQNCGHPFCGSPQDPATVVVQSITTGPNHLRGTWVHPRLAVDLARWISPAFAVWMDGWFLETTGRDAPHHQPTTPGITVAARTEREAMQLWQAAIEAETTRALRLTLGTTGRTDAGLRPSGQWRFVAC
jgi:hypothetical protein